MDRMTESELWGKMAHLLSLTAKINSEKTVVALLEIMRGAGVDPVAMSWHMDKRLSQEIKAVCASMGIPYDNTPSATVIADGEKEVGH